MPLTPERTRERRAERRDAGLCIQCGKTPAEPGRVRCSACLAYTRRWFTPMAERTPEAAERERERVRTLQAALRVQRAASGSCKSCGSATAPLATKRLCAACREVNRAYQAAYARRRRAKEKRAAGSRRGAPAGWHKLRGLRQRLERWVLTCRRCGGLGYQDVYKDICCRTCGATLWFSQQATG